MTCRPVATEFRRNGFDYKVIRRDGLKLLLEQHDPVSGRNFYELVVTRIGQPHPRDQRAIDCGFSLVEQLPSSEEWGTCGWTFRDIHEAKQRFIALGDRPIDLGVELLQEPP